MGLGFRVWGLGFRGRGSRWLGVQGFGFYSHADDDDDGDDDDDDDVLPALRLFALDVKTGLRGCSGFEGSGL